MKVLRQQLFSKKNKKETTSEKKNKEDLKTAAGVATVAGAIKLGHSAGDKITNRAGIRLYQGINASKTEEAKEIEKKLLEKAKDQGIRVINDPGFSNSAYLGTDAARGARKIGKKLRDAQRKGNKSAGELADKIIGRGISRTEKNLGKDVISIGGSTNSTAVLAHELGHAQYHKHRSKGVVGNLAHRLHGASSIAINTLTNPTKNKQLKPVSRMANLAVGAGGFRRGKNSVTTDENGKIKVNGKQAIKSAAIGVSFGAPVLIAEAAASRKGLKMMKKAGASKELLKSARKDLGNAWLTYAGQASKPVVTELGGHISGVGYGYLREKKKKEK